MLSACSKCGVVYFGDRATCEQCKAPLLELEIVARSQTYTEAGGTIEGIDTVVAIGLA